MFRRKIEDATEKFIPLDVGAEEYVAFSRQEKPSQYNQGIQLSQLLIFMTHCYCMTLLIVSQY